MWNIIFAVLWNLFGVLGVVVVLAFVRSLLGKWHRRNNVAARLEHYLKWSEQYWREAGAIREQLWSESTDQNLFLLGQNFLKLRGFPKCGQALLDKLMASKSSQNFDLAIIYFTELYGTPRQGQAILRKLILHDRIVEACDNFAKLYGTPELGEQILQGFEAKNNYEAFIQNFRYLLGTPDYGRIFLRDLLIDITDKKIPEDSYEEHLQLFVRAFSTLYGESYEGNEFLKTCMKQKICLLLAVKNFKLMSGTETEASYLLELLLTPNASQDQEDYFQVVAKHFIILGGTAEELKRLLYLAIEKQNLHILAACVDILFPDPKVAQQFNKAFLLSSECNLDPFIERLFIERLYASRGDDK